MAAAALFETLFNKRTIGQRDEYSQSILIDTFKDVYMHPDIKKRDRNSNIICSVDLVNLIGWKEHESQQRPKERGSAKFSLREVVQELNSEPAAEGEEKHEVKYGVLIDDGDEVK